MRKRGNASLKEYVRNHQRFITLTGILLLLVVIFTFVSSKFLEFQNLMNIVRQTCVLAIIAVGMTCVILSGGIDLSVGANVALSGMVAGLVSNYTRNGYIAVIAAVIVGLAVGLINGILVGRMKITAFIATLAMTSVARGTTLMISNAESVKVNDLVISYLGQADIFGIPVTLFIVLIIYVIFVRINNSYIFGRHIYAIGGNISAARAMGISVEKRLTQIYAIAGALAGIGGVITVGRMSSAQPYSGLNLEFDVITAVVLGGTSLVGGSGTILGTILGSALVGIISNGLGLTSLSPFSMYIVKGLLILFAVLMDQYSVAYRDKEFRLIKKNKKEHAVFGTRENNSSKKTVHMKNIVKLFPGMRALDNVSVSFESGQIHALMGENGAGKSTLMKILNGEVEMDDGVIFINDEHVDIDSPQKAAELGIALIHQEFSLVQELTVYQNIFLGNEISRKRSPFVDKKKMRQESRQILASIQVDLDVDRKVKNLTVSEQQIVEIAKALRKDAWLLILDEPTSSLTEEGKRSLFSVMHGLREEGVGMVYISHRMQEVYEIADNITILRDGVKEGTYTLDEVSSEQIVHKMVGRELGDVFNREKGDLGETMLTVKGLTRYGVFRDINFQVRKGEVLGLSGLVGAGRTEIAKSIFGLDNYDEGSIYVNNEEVEIKSCTDAIDLGIAYVPEDRRLEGFIPLMSIKFNLAMPMYPRISQIGKIDKNKESEISDKYINYLQIKTVSENKNVAHLSGGNQQKVSLGKWLATSPKVLILDEPTRGIDVGAKQEIHKIIQTIAQQGIAVILISSEMPELLGCADNILVIREGEITGRFTSEEATQEKIMTKAAYTE